MKKSIRVRKAEKWGDVDKSLISALEHKCLSGGYPVNISDPVARVMVEKGWVINLDPMKEIKSPRKVMEIIHKKPDVAGGVVNPGLQEETDGTEGTEDIPPEDSGEDSGDNGRGSAKVAGGEVFDGTIAAD